MKLDHEYLIKLSKENLIDECRHLAFELGRAVRTATLRDQFAMAALTGMLAATRETEYVSWDTMASAAYRAADAMLAAREEKK